jgi:hypothetical protein
MVHPLDCVHWHRDPSPSCGVEWTLLLWFTLLHPVVTGHLNYSTPTSGNTDCHGGLCPCQPWSVLHQSIRCPPQTREKLQSHLGMAWTSALRSPGDVQPSSLGTQCKGALVKSVHVFPHQKFCEERVAWSSLCPAKEFSCGSVRATHSSHLLDGPEWGCRIMNDRLFAYLSNPAFGNIWYWGNKIGRMTGNKYIEFQTCGFYRCKCHVVAQSALVSPSCCLEGLIWNTSHAVRGGICSSPWGYLESSFLCPVNISSIPGPNSQL